MIPPKLSRRGFLLATATGALVAAGCSDDTGDAATGSPGSSSTVPASTTTLKVPDLSGDPFTLGVASGDPLADRVILWTRLAPEPATGGGMPAEPVSVLWEVATDESFGAIVSSGVAEASPAHAHAVHVDATGLQADSWYHYRFKVGTWTSPVGRTRTAPAKDAAAKELRFAMASCQAWEAGFYNAYRDLVTTELDVVVFLGDYIYEYAASAAVGPKTARLGRGPECTTLELYRDRYALYKSDPLLQGAHAHCPWIVIWDDHEVQNNYAGDHSQDSSITPEVFAQRRAAAYQAWWEHQPVRLDAPTGPEYQIYRELSWGTLANFIMLDERQYRTDQACGDATLQLTPPCDEVRSPGRTMTGADQQQWFFDRLNESRSTWNIVGNEVVMTDVTIKGAVLNYDQWDGYPEQRETVLRYIRDNQFNNVVMVTGDIHLNGVGNLTLSGTDGTRTTVATELVGTSISSGGLLPEGVDSLVKASIPDLVYFNQQRGWCHNTVTAERWTAEYRVVENNLVENSPVSVGGTFHITPDKPGAISA